MLELAEEADREDEATDAATDLPAEIQCREDRLRILAEVKQRIAQREKERIALEQAEHDEILAERRSIAEKNGKRFDTKAPARPKKKHKKQAQLNLTDGRIAHHAEQRRIYSRVQCANCRRYGFHADCCYRSEPTSDRPPFTSTDAGKAK